MSGVEGDGGVVREIADLARRGVDVSVLHLADGREFAVLVDPKTGNQTLNDITPAGYRAALPDHIEGAVTLSTKDSFVDYVNAYKTPTARMFAALNDTGGGSIVCELDYHASGAPGRRAHRATYALKNSEEWDRWSSISGRLMEQTKFLRWLEENATDITAPDGATIMEMVQDFSVKRKVDFRSAVRLQNGDTSFEYVQAAEANSKGGEIAVPSKFELTMPVFFGEPSMKVFAFLRYDIESGLKLGIELHRPVYVRQALFKQIGDDIAARTGATLHYGTASSR